MKKLLFLAMLAATAILHAGEPIVADAEYAEMPQAWALKKILGQDFWCRFSLDTSKGRLDDAWWRKWNPTTYIQTLLPDYYIPADSMPENILALSKMSAFSKTALDLTLREKNNGDDTWSFPIANLPMTTKRMKEIPVQISVPRPGSGMSRLYYISKFKHDHAYYNEWKKQYPNFIGFITMEWGNDAIILHQKFRHGGLKSGRFAINDEEIKKLVETEWREPKDRKDHIDHLLKKTFDRITEFAFNDPQMLDVGEGHWNIGHLAAYWGAGMIGIETTRNYAYWQNQMLFCRGAARQFDIPWHWYGASYFSGYDSDGTRTSAGSLSAENRSARHGPAFGISLSAMKRACYLAYLSGASMWQRESAAFCYFLHDLPMEQRKLSAEGEDYVKFFDFTTKNPDRGIPYTPVALLVPYDRGYCRFGGKAFSSYDYTHGDYMLDAIMATMLRYHENRLTENMKKGIECVMANHPHGDIFDALTPDFADQKSFQRALPNYRAAILIGEYAKNPEMAKILTHYVSNGGTLVINVKQMTDDYPEDFTGIKMPGATIKNDDWKIEKAELITAKAIREDSDGNVIFAKNRYGKGNVIITTQHYMTPWFGDDATGQKKALDTTELGNPERFADIEALLQQLSGELLPVRVGGDIQYGLNKTGDGWWLWLINNKGVTKFGDKPQQLDPNGSQVKVDLHKFGGSKVTELLSGENITIRNNGFTYCVPSGGVAVFHIRKRNNLFF